TSLCFGKNISATCYKQKEIIIINCFIRKLISAFQIKNSKCTMKDMSISSLNIYCSCRLIYDSVETMTIMSLCHKWFHSICQVILDKPHEDRKLSWHCYSCAQWL